MKRATTNSGAKGRRIELTRALETGGHSVEEAQILTNSLVKMVESLRKASAVDGQQIPVNLSTPQLVGILERLTLALKAPETEGE